jgi:hypothetical protein
MRFFGQVTIIFACQFVSYWLYYFSRLPLATCSCNKHLHVDAPAYVHVCVCIKSMPRYVATSVLYITLVYGPWPINIIAVYTVVYCLGAVGGPCGFGIMCAAPYLVPTPHPQWPVIFEIQ